ncbi:unnamed protein product [Anisakis simplex]|uniref:Uncharacterized protein n=1 Tax=Anisakis simplex TaxID=6269 RepID=A0A3P6NPW5_ANISI|nr:unnamed protein product [Anisakis simplex]
MDDLNFANLSSEAEMQEADNYMKRLEDCELQVFHISIRGLQMNVPVPPYLCAPPPTFCGNASSLMITLADCVILVGTALLFLPTQS